MNNRIDRIDGSNYYHYDKVNNLNVSDTGEKFSLDYKQEDLQPEAKEKKDKPESEQEKQQASERNGVRLEISDGGRLANKESRQQADKARRQSQTAVSPRDLLVSIQEFVTSTIAAVKDFFYKIWNDPQPEEAISDENVDRTEDDAAYINAVKAESQTENEINNQINSPIDEQGQDAETYYMEEARLDKKIQPYLRSGDLNQVVSLLTDNGRKTPARNSTLLTYYDRNGRMVEPNASDRERILYGDRNARKL